MAIKVKDLKIELTDLSEVSKKLRESSCFGCPYSKVDASGTHCRRLPGQPCRSGEFKDKGR